MAKLSTPEIKTFNEQGLVDAVHHKGEGVATFNNASLHDDVMGEKFNSRFGKARGHANLDSINDHVTFTKGGTSLSTAEFEKLVERKSKLTEHLADVNRTKSLDSYRHKDLDAVEKKISKMGKDISGHLSESAELHQNALEALQTRKDELIGKVEKDFNKELKLLKAAHTNEKGAVVGEKALERKIGILEEGHKNRIEFIEEQFTGKAKPLEEHISGLSAVAKNVEKTTGIKLDTKNLSLSKDGAGFFREVAANFEKGGALGKTKVGLGAIAGIGLAGSAIGDIVGEKPKDKDGNEIDTSIFVPLVKLGAAAAAVFAMTHGAGKLVGVGGHR
jgi:hypothetical protein